MKKPTHSPYARIIDTPAIIRSLVLTSLGGNLLIGLSFWFINGLDGTSLSLLLVSLVSAGLLLLLKAGYYQATGLILYLIVSSVLTFNIGLGHAIYDEAMVAIPLLIIFSGLIFGKRASVLVTGISVAQLTLIYSLAQRGYVKPFDGAYIVPLEDTITTMIILIASGFLIWIVIDIIESKVLQIQESEQELENAYDLTLSAWAKALEFRKREDPGHSDRVTGMAVKLAEEIGLDPDHIKQVRQGALLHDVGKMGIPERILLKPTQLDGNEKELLAKHTLLAEEIIKNIDYLEGALEIISSHHERYDGTGYPGKLAGEEIPISAQIFAVVDTWDTLRTSSPCRKAWTDAQDLAFVKEQSGKKFHPDIVGAFLGITSELREGELG